jgi:uncharacterized protein (DUF433 family)
MVRLISHALVLTGVLACVAAPSFADDKDKPAGDNKSAGSYRADDPQLMQDFQRYRRMGYSSRDVSMALNAARRSGRQPEDIFARLDRGQTWAQIASDLNLTERDLTEPEIRVAAYQERGGGSMSGSSTMAWEGGWSRAYRFTPLEQKRLRAMGLTNKQIYIVANTARLTGRDPGDIAQMIFRGMTVSMIADEYNLIPTVLETPRPEWTTPEWDQAVERGSAWPMPTSGDRGMPRKEGDHMGR